MSAYANKPVRFLSAIGNPTPPSLSNVYSVGFEFAKWRCTQFANHLLEWIVEFALPEEELQLHAGNALIKLREAAVRIYTSKTFSKRGEVGEIALHAICRDFFDTVPISPRVFYKSASNDPIKAFDMVHARSVANNEVELWLGESKLYTDAKAAVKSAIASIKEHTDQGFLTNERVLLGPAVPKSTPNYAKIRKLFEPNTSLDDFLKQTVFATCILGNSPAVASASACDPAHTARCVAEMQQLQDLFDASGLPKTITILLLYVPLLNKDDLVKEFDVKLKALQP